MNSPYAAAATAALALVVCALAAQADDEPYAGEPGRFVVELEPTTDLDAFLLRWDAALLRSSEEFHCIDVPGDPELFLEEVQESGEVRSVESNRRQQSPEAVRHMVFGAMGGTYGEYADQDLAGRIGLDEAHVLTRGEGIVVAVLDSGIDPLHELFRESMLPGYDFVDRDDHPFEEANGVDDDEDGWVDEGFGHGSMVAGLVRLVAPEATLLPVRVLDDEGRTDSFRLVEAIRWAVANGADVINLSLGAPHTIASVRKVVQEAHDAGIVVVAASGNEDRQAPAFHPADVPEALMITAVDEADIKAGFADYGSKVTIAAPGSMLRSAYPFANWSVGSGCSFSTALVSGAVAILGSYYEDTDPTSLTNRIHETVVPIEHLPGNEPYVGRLGTGRLFLPAGLGETASVQGPPTRIAALEIVPNPAAEDVEVSLRNGESRVSGTLEVVDPSGRIVYSASGFEGSLRWNLRDSGGQPVAAGVYFLRVLEADRIVASGRISRLR